VTGGVSFQGCKKILFLKLKDVKYGDHKLAIPDNVQHVENVSELRKDQILRYALS